MGLGIVLGLLTALVLGALVSAGPLPRAHNALPLASVGPSRVGGQDAIVASIAPPSWTGSCVNPYPITIHLNGSATGGYPPYTFTWSFGDGTPTATGQNVTHPYSSFGPYAYNVTLWVTDTRGGNGSAQVQVVAIPPPCAVQALLYGPGTLIPLAIVLGLFGTMATALSVLVYQRGRPPAARFKP